MHGQNMVRKALCFSKDVTYELLDKVKNEIDDNDELSIYEKNDGYNTITIIRKATQKSVLDNNTNLAKSVGNILIKECNKITY